MIANITTIEDVKNFAKQLIGEGISINPDDDFNDYVNFATNSPSYNKEDAAFRNKLMEKCYEVCENEGIDIYEIMMRELLLGTGLDKFIPLPPEQ